MVNSYACYVNGTQEIWSQQPTDNINHDHIKRIHFSTQPLPFFVPLKMMVQLTLVICRLFTCEFGYSHWKNWLKNDKFL